MMAMASQGGHLEVVHELCERGADVNASFTDKRITALMFATIKGHREVVLRYESMEIKNHKERLYSTLR